jgi:N-acetylmuramic acid 6-phosphate etherase
VLAGGEQALSRAGEANEDDPSLGAVDLESRGFESKDVLVGIAASGRTPYVLGAVEYARKLGAVTIGVSCTPDSELAKAVEIPITPLAGPEILAGSTRMKAGTATKLVLNMLSTAAMIRLGYVFGNLMVNVQPRNSKLEDRARRIIAQATGVDTELAGALLKRADGDVKTAIVLARLGVSKEDARKRLREAAGRVSRALKC